MGETSTIDKSLENIKTLYAYFEDSHQYIRNCNKKYNPTDTISFGILNRERSNSDKILITNLISGNLYGVDGFTTKVTQKIERLCKFTLSEIAHSKLKEIEFEMDNSFIHKKLRKDYRSLKNDLFKLDDDVLNYNIGDDKKTTLEFETVIGRLEELECDIGDEKKSSLFSTVKNFAFMGITILIPILIGLYPTTINPYLLLLLYVISLFIIYTFLKVVSQIKIIYMHTKNNTRRLVPLTIVVIMPFLMAYTIYTGSNTGGYVPLLILITAVIFVMLSIILNFKEAIENTKAELIQDELNELAIKYKIWGLTPPPIGVSHTHHSLSYFQRLDEMPDIDKNVR